MMLVVANLGLQMVVASKVKLVVLSKYSKSPPTINLKNRIDS